MGVLPLKVMVPIPEWQRRYMAAPWLVKLVAEQRNGLEKDSAADALQVRSVSQTRFVRRLGELCDEAMEEITEALGVVLAIKK